MLNRQKLAQKLNEISNTLFIDTSHECALARASWNRLVTDEAVLQKLAAIDTSLLIPQWDGALDAAITIAPMQNPYCAIAVDGSQVYPDRHEGVRCFLINIGVAHIVYGLQMPVIFSSDPTVFSGFDADDRELENSHDIVNCIRQELELDATVHAGIAAQSMLDNTAPIVLLCDGSLIFWHLESKGPYLRDRFLHAYIGSLQQLYERDLLHAGYISLPKSKELVNLVRLELCNFKPSESTNHQQIRCIVDTAIAGFYLKSHMRSNVFKSTASICAYYPDHLQPYFFYLDVGHEIARVEIPQWIARDDQHVDTVAAVILDQAMKGHGYPVVLAESHEQAVVKGPDREFFYLMMTKLAIDHKKTRHLSQKSVKKRGMGI